MKFIYFLIGIILLHSCEKKSLNEKEILKIIHSNEGYENRNLKKDFFTGDEFIDSIKTFRKTITEENFKPIYEADFNNDGKKDYLVNLSYPKISNENDVVKIHISEDNNNPVILLSKDKDYEILNPGKSHVYEIIASKIIQFKNQSLIKLINYNKNFDGLNQVFQYDTLMIKNNELIEYTNNIKKHKIEKIVFTQNGGYAPGVIYQLSLSNDSLTFTSNYYKNFKGEYKSYNNNPFKKFESYLNEVDFSNLKNNYHLPCADCSSIETKIVFDNGKTKRIYDYGEKGSLVLIKLYEEIEKTVVKEKWTIVK